ncbi:ankyrin repeat-containing domain protein [Amylocarpus encephaloides]|uniref:Ankyrin repeat-containing domain protein n=1 Tax=Amylocarpus encephaloides TaxID=45428 RepID=A0A9P8BZT4_9HELO|nr:ankyrin repeat-containing domain protein [Amylocarpus encephaloides]
MAARAGSVDLMRDLLDKGTVTSHAMKNIACTPLHFVCYRELPDAAKALVDKGDLASKDLWGRTPLSGACATGHLQAVKVLLGHYEKKDWVEGLISAAHYGHQDVARYLLDMGCPVNEMNTKGETALFCAATSDRPRIARLLLLRSANPGLLNSNNELAIHSASQLGSLETARLLIETGTQLEAENMEGSTPLGLAIFNEHEALVHLLLERGARMRLCPRWGNYTALLEFSWGLSSMSVTKVLLDFYAQGKHEDGLTPAKALIIAMDRGSKKLLRLVLEKWFASGDTTGNLSAGEALHYAVSKGHVEYLKLTLQNPIAKASINEEQPKLGTPLHAAIGMDRYSSKIVKLLLENGADAEIVAGQFGTTLNAACATARFDIAKKLLDILPRKVVASVTGKYGTPIQSAIVGFQREPSEITVKMLDLLEAHDCSLRAIGGFYFAAFHAAVRLSALEVIVWFMKRDNHVVLRTDMAGRLPLHLAIFRGDWDILKEVIDGTNQLWLRPMSWWLRMHTDLQGRTGLHWAAVSTVETLMAKMLPQPDDEDKTLSSSNGSVVDLKDIDGWTPLHWACRQPKKEIVDALLAHGADTKALTNESWTPRHIAILHGINDEDYLKALPDTGDIGEGLPEGEGTRFARACGVCLVHLCWKYYHCTSEDCDDFDLCFKCYKHADNVHDNDHEFNCITST